MASYSESQIFEKKNNDTLVRKICNDENYRISQDGTILTLVQQTGKVSVCGNWRLLIPKIADLGYVSIRYKYKYLSIHRIVYQKFVGELDHKKQINHIDGNPRNNNFKNLEQVSQSENLIHSYRVLKRKPVLGNFKINQEIAENIRTIYKTGSTYKELAKQFSISKTTVFNVIKNKNWPQKSEAS